ncbi:hypothetical protein STRAU_0821 [Streptomyces aurantiacus JA 4570]|uniref:Lipoprotein n=1 Tax=Streptomyces aurantiacus JA 4570 TaxID=1286094 RepID=S4A5U4_9ACTN|nr:hypothetical protein STRAU_0821 [Streptomyces aurantiacus JA 4570]
MTTAACSGSDGDGGEQGRADVSASPVAEKSPTASASAKALTAAGAKAALLTEADLEDDWTQVKDAATWRDSLLIGKVKVADFLTGKADAADCQKLLDALYGDDLLGKPTGASALTGFADGGDARLLQQVAAYDQSRLDKSLAWLKTLPVTCDQFTVTGGDAGRRTVQVVETSLPGVGDARQGLRVTLKGETDGSPTTLTLDVAAVRIGPNALTVTGGGLDGLEDDTTEQAVRQGTDRLEDVLTGRTPPAQPGDGY